MKLHILLIFDFLCLGTLLAKSELLHEYSNHPVHILNKERKLSPSALVPFCEFGGNSKIMGIMMKNFTVPVCNSFKTKTLNNQLCYELNLNKFKSYFSAESLKTGVTFFVDKNDERQYTWETKHHHKKGNLESIYT